MQKKHRNDFHSPQNADSAGGPAVNDKAPAVKD